MKEVGSFAAVKHLRTETPLGNDPTPRLRYRTELVGRAVVMGVYRI
jgi:hypothetical protein